MYYPAITTAALFTAIIIRDSVTRNSSDIPHHAFVGLICVAAMIFLSMNKADFVAWGLLVLPMFIIILSYILTYFNSPIMSSSSTSSSSSSSTTNTNSAIENANVKPSSMNTNEKSILTGQTIQIPLNNTGTGISSSTVTPSSSSCSARTV